MPTRICGVSPCPHPAHYRGYCRIHARERSRQTHPNKSFYNSARWKYTRRRQLHEQPLCAVCGDVAEHADHIRAIQDGGNPWSFANLDSLCAICHGRKTRREQLA